MISFSETLLCPTEAELNHKLIKKTENLLLILAFWLSLDKAQASQIKRVLIIIINTFNYSVKARMIDLLETRRMEW